MLEKIKKIFKFFKNRPIFGSLLFVIFPILFIFNQNKDQLLLEINSLLIVLFILLATVTIFWILLGILIKNKYKRSILLTLYVFLFFSYGHFYNIFKHFYFPITNDFIVGPNKLIFSLFVIILFIVSFYVLFVLKNKRILQELANFINVIGIVLVVYQILNILFYFNLDLFKISFNSKSLKETENLSKKMENSANYPDIYYIILDAYARDDTLREIYDYDNSEFIDFLKNNGFYVASQSKSNYAHTFLSLSSSLNMEYVNYFTDEIGINSNDVSIPLQKISKNKVVSFLKSKGYDFINFSSGWGPTDKNNDADINIQNGQQIIIGKYQFSINEYYLTILKTTIAYPFLEDFIATSMRNKIINNFDKILEVPNIDGPTFVLAHFPVPHPPFLFDVNGDLPKQSELDLIGEVYEDKINYLNQLIYVTNKTQYMIERLLYLAGKNSIIILQSDHGPCTILGHPFEWERPPENKINGIRERMYILNAYYFPNYKEDKLSYDLLYNSISPVNSFRMIFNLYFGEDLEILPDYNYYSDYINHYEFFDVTKDL